MPDSFDYSVVNSENAQLLRAIIDDAPEYTKETGSRNAEILKSIINDTEYTDAPQSEIEELLLELKEKIAGGGGDITVESLNVTANGTYQEEGKAYSPVVVNVPTPEDSYQLKSLPTGAISSITDGANLPMPSLKIGIEPVQEGSGDPSPENIRPISGHTEANVVVSPTTDAEDGQTYNIQFKDGDNPLTVYGGTLDVVSGVLTVDKGYISDWRNYTFEANTNGNYSYEAYTIFDKQKGIYNIISNKLPVISPYTDVAEYSMRGYPNDGALAIKLPKTVATNANEIKQWMISNNITVCYELATPTTIQLTPTAVKSLLGTNNIWADTGDVMSGEYFSKL